MGDKMEKIKRLSELDGYENVNKYAISNFGRIFSSKTEDAEDFKEIKGSVDSKGYKYLDIRSQNAKLKCPKVHRLVAEAFIPNPDNLPQINHIDGNKRNNHISNLEWVSNKNNRIHAIENELQNFINYGIAQYDLDGNFIANFDTAEEALKSLGKPPYSGNIGRVIRGTRKTAYGYIWKQISSSTTIENTSNLDGSE